MKGGEVLHAGVVGEGEKAKVHQCGTREALTKMSEAEAVRLAELGDWDACEAAAAATAPSSPVCHELLIRCAIRRSDADRVDQLSQIHPSCLADLYLGRLDSSPSPSEGLLWTWAWLHRDSFQLIPPQLQHWHLLRLPITQCLQSLSNNCDILLGLAHLCLLLHPLQQEMDEHSSRTSFQPLASYLRGHREIRQLLHQTRERLRLLHHLPDAQDDLLGSGWLFTTVAQQLARSPQHTTGALHARALYRCHFRQPQKAEQPPQHQQLPFHSYLWALRYFCAQQWEAFLFRHSQAQACAALQPADGARLACLLVSYHLYHTLDHLAALCAHEARPQLHRVLPRTSLLYFLPSPLAERPLLECCHRH